jgi:hypothetical protein
MASTLLGSLLVSLGLESGAFKSGLAEAEKAMRMTQKRIEAVGKNMVDMGQTLSVAVTAPLIAIGTASVKAAMESKDALAQVNAALASMGNQAGRTSEQLQAMAGGLMKQSLFDDDEILRKVTANMLTFGNVAGENFDKAQLAAVNLAARLGTDLQSATLMVGKALNDPAKGIAALKRAGIQFTEQQKEQIETMVAAGNAAGAQAIMLAELEKQFGGAAKAARDANPFAVMQQSWAEFQEKVGDQLLKAMPAITSAITAVLEAFNSLSPGMQQAVVIGGVLAAALGPVLIVLGSLVTVAAPLIAAFSTIAGAIGGLSGIVVAAAASFAGLMTVLAPILIPLAAVAAAVTAVYLAWKHWDQIKALVSDIGAAVSTWWNGTVKPVFAAMGAAVAGAVMYWTNLRNSVVESISSMVSSVRDWLVNKLGSVWKFVTDKIETVKKAFFGLYDAVVGHSYVPDMVDGIAEQMRRLDAVMVDPAKKATAATKEAFRKLAEDVKPLLDRLFPEAAAANAYGADFSQLEKARNAGMLNREQFGTATERLQNERFAGMPANDNAPGAIAGWDTPIAPAQDWNKELGQLSATMTAALPNLSSFNMLFADSGLTLERFTGELSEAFTDVIMGAKSFGDAIRGVFNRMATRVLDSLINNLLSQALGSVLGGIPGFATGTNFAPGGMALVGEKGPELVNLPRGSQVIPNHELPGLAANSNTVHSPTFVFPGIADAKGAREAAGQAARRYRRELNPMRGM